MAAPLGDTWEFAGTSWTNITGSVSGTPPSPRYDFGMTYDFANFMILLFGGIGPSHSVLGEYGWAFQPPVWYDGAIANSMPRSPDPIPRFGASLVFNSTGGYVLLFGGCQDTGIQNGSCGPLESASDTWIFVNGGWSQVCTGCGPSARWDSALSFDPVDDEFVLFGGCRPVELCPASATLGDTWKFGASHWTLLTPSTHPPARADASIAFDGLDSAVILFGGYGCTGAGAPLCSDTWKFVGGTWTNLNPATSPGLRYGAAMTYDSSDHYVLLFGGQSGGGVVLSDTWTFTRSSGWTRISASAPFAARYDAGMAFDSAQSVAVLFGGATSSGTPLGDTEIFSAGAWSSPTTLSVHPPAGWGAGMVYDPDGGPNGYLVLFGASLGVSEYSTGSVLGGDSPGQSFLWEYLANPSPTAAPQWTDVSYFG
jgi:hypothetical protein